MSDDKVIVGRIVHFVYDNGSEQCTAAIVTRVFEDKGLGLGTIGINYFPWADANDMATAYECQEKPIPGTWHWPQGCPR